LRLKTLTDIHTHTHATGLR